MMQGNSTIVSPVSNSAMVLACTRRIPFRSDNSCTNVVIISMGTSDADGDQIPDVWESANGLDPNNPNDATLDPDLDGLTNLQEYQAGTNPRDSRSVLRLVASRYTAAGSNLVLVFSAAANRNYSIHYTDQLNPPAWNYLTNISAVPDAREIRLPMATPGSRRFYRVATPYVTAPQISKITLLTGGTNVVIRFDAAAYIRYTVEYSDQARPAQTGPP